MRPGYFDPIDFAGIRISGSPMGSRQSTVMLKMLRLLCANILFILSVTSSSALAQSADDSWSEPLNLSQLGVAVNPDIVIDSDGIVHAVWQDDLANYKYSQLNGSQWSAPETTNLNRLFNLPPPGEAVDPSQMANYTGPNPLFIAGPDENIFAFWISPEGRLSTSKVKNESFKDAAGWDSGRLILPEAASFAATVDTRGELHLAYLRTIDDPVRPSGIYYTNSKNGGRSWSAPLLLYGSPYLHTLGEGEANLSITTAGTEEPPRLYIAWDNRPRKQVFLAQSLDGGESWEEPWLVAGPAPNSGPAGPFNIHVAAKLNSVVLIWQNGQPEGFCSQVYQASADAGVTWMEPQPVLEDLVGCAQSNEFVTELANSSNGPLYMLTKTQRQVFLTAWNGRQWSEPQAQSMLSGFEDPEVFREVIYGCHRAALSGEQLYIVGCDEGGGGDIWVTSRDLGTTSSLFWTPDWSQLSPVTDSPLELEDVKLVTTDDNLIHAFFSRRQEPVIYYTFWNGEVWSHIIPVLALADGEAAWPAIASGPGDELFLIAQNNRGALYFSRATSGNAATESRWSKPARVTTAHDGQIGSIDVAWDSAGTVYVAYSVPVNEERGIYLVQSNDHGATWSEPIQVFDGRAAGFDIVGPPSLLPSANTTLHVVWKEQLIQRDGLPQPLSLYYTQSEDGGRTFSDAELVVEDSVAWQDVVTDGKGNLHLLWQRQDAVTTLWDQVSLDDGSSWQFPQGLPHEGTLLTVTGDPAGRLHLLGSGSGALDHWLWDGSRWQPEKSFFWSLGSQQDGSVNLLSAVVNRQGEMVVVLAVPAGADDSLARTLLFTTHTVKLPSKQIGVQDAPTQMLLPPTLTPATSTPERSLTPASTVESEPARSQSQTDHNETDARISPFTMALLPVALLLLSVMGFVIRRLRRNEDG